MLIILNAQCFCSWFYFPPHPPHVLAAQGDTQGSETGKDGVISDTEEPMGCRECSVSTSVTPEEVGVYDMIVGTGIYSQLTQIGIRIIMG